MQKCVYTLPALALLHNRKHRGKVAAKPECLLTPLAEAERDQVLLVRCERYVES
jgi:hypothetical protein